MDQYKVLGIKIHAATNAEAREKVASFFDQKTPQLIFTPNTEIITMAQSDEQLKKILNHNSSLNLADGIGLLWAAKFKTLNELRIPVLREIVIFVQWMLSIIMLPVAPGWFNNPIPERVAGADFVVDLAKLAAERKRRMFLLGGMPTVAEQCALKLQTDILDLRIGGINSGTPNETDDIVEQIKGTKSEVLLVAFGAPKQEKWLAKNISLTGCSIGMGVGGTFDFISGRKKRAPTWMRRCGLEWFYRLAIEPGRIGRQLAIPKFMILVLIDKIRKRG